MTPLCLAVSLFPLAIYLFFLAGLNRRDQPVLLHGLWEAAALLFALSGFLLFTLPQLLNELYTRELLAVPLEENSEEPFETILFKWRVIWVAYYLAVAGLAGALILSRLRQRGVYNVDMEGFRDGLARTLDDMALTSRAEGSTLYIYPTTGLGDDKRAAVPQEITAITEAVSSISSPGPTPAGEEAGVADIRSKPPLAVLAFDVFPALGHVSLEWIDAHAGFRADFEGRLLGNLRHASAADNPAAAWFIGVGSMIMGALFMMLALYLFGHFLRH